MLELKELRRDPKGCEAKLKNKVPEVCLAEVLSLDEKVRALKTEVEELKSKRNSGSKEIGERKRKGEDMPAFMQELAILGDSIDLKDKEVTALEIKLKYELDILPNFPMDDVPVSPSPADNVCIKTFGEKPIFNFPIKNHVELNEKLKLFDFVRGAKIAGSGWPLYTDRGARLEWALLNYMLDTQRKNGFVQVMPPLLARPEIMHGSAQLPKFESQLFKLKDEDYHLYLIPTSECAINGMYYDEIIEEEQLPLKYAAYTPCFRREAGGAGRNERGLIRTHQFNKVEMFCLTKPEDGVRVYNEMMASAEEVLQGLGIHYKNMLLTTGDMSFAAAKTIDIEAWLPGQGYYKEVSSVSNCTDFQARRSNIRFRPQGGKTEFVHTLNGSGLATSRVMVALLENNQQADGSVLVPKVLLKYLGDDMAVLR
jgi:seryl-tRNA synthetase